MGEPDQREGAEAFDVHLEWPQGEHGSDNSASPSQTPPDTATADRYDRADDVTELRWTAGDEVHEQHARLLALEAAVASLETQLRRRSQARQPDFTRFAEGWQADFERMVSEHAQRLDALTAEGRVELDQAIAAYAGEIQRFVAAGTAELDRVAVRWRAELDDTVTARLSELHDAATAAMGELGRVAEAHLRALEQPSSRTTQWQRALTARLGEQTSQIAQLKRMTTIALITGFFALLIAVAALLFAR